MAGPALARCVDEVAKFMPEVRQLNIPARLSNNVTLSTMHGCPPGEIGKIARYLIEEWGLHTSVKLNPTLLGPEGVRGILNDRLGYRNVTVPDLAFDGTPEPLPTPTEPRLNPTGNWRASLTSLAGRPARGPGGLPASRTTPGGRRRGSATRSDSPHAATPASGR